MKNKEITLNDLMATYEKESFHECFGITNERGLQIVKEIEDTIMLIHRDPTWSPAKLLKRIADSGITKNFKETALVVFLVGCHVGEDSVYQGLVNQAVMKTMLDKKKGDTYVN
jgi:transcription termination factor Rho